MEVLEQFKSFSVVFKRSDEDAFSIYSKTLELIHKAHTSCPKVTLPPLHPICGSKSLSLFMWEDTKFYPYCYADWVVRSSTDGG